MLAQVLDQAAFRSLGSADFVTHAAGPSQCFCSTNVLIEAESQHRDFASKRPAAGALWGHEEKNGSKQPQQDTDQSRHISAAHQRAIGDPFEPEPAETSIGRGYWLNAHLSESDDRKYQSCGGVAKQLKKNVDQVTTPVLRLYGRME